MTADQFQISLCNLSGTHKEFRWIPQSVNLSLNNIQLLLPYFRIKVYIKNFHLKDNKCDLIINTIRQPTLCELKCCNIITDVDGRQPEGEVHCSPPISDIQLGQDSSPSTARGHSPAGGRITSSAMPLADHINNIVSTIKKKHTRVPMLSSYP